MDKMLYNVQLTSTYAHTYQVLADDRDSAIKKAEELHKERGFKESDINRDGVDVSYVEVDPSMRRAYFLANAKKHLAEVQECYRKAGWDEACELQGKIEKLIGISIFDFDSPLDVEAANCFHCGTWNWMDGNVEDEVDCFLDDESDDATFDDFLRQALSNNKYISLFVNKARSYLIEVNDREAKIAYLEAELKRLKGE